MKGMGFRWIIGNYKAAPIEVHFPAGANASVRRLNTKTAAPALEQPYSFWSATNAAPLAAMPFRLAPFEILFIDQPILPEAF